MKSELPKVLHPVLGKSMVEWSVDMAESVTLRKPVVVVGHEQEQVRAVLGDRVEYVVQAQRLGTGHAVQQAKRTLFDRADIVVVTYADMPLLRSETVDKLVQQFRHEQEQPDPPVMAILSVTREDPQGFGRILRDEAGQVIRVVEEVDCTPDQRDIKELNSGIYCFCAEWLWDNVDDIPMSPKGEYYLPDMVAIAVSQGRRLVTVDAPAEEVNGVNTRIHLAEAEQLMRRRILDEHMLNGVSIMDPDSTYIEAGITIGMDSVILPGCILQGDTSIGARSQIGPYSHVLDSAIGDDCRVTYSVVERAIMDDESDIGPFGHLRKGARLGVGAHMGNFGEMKNSYLGPGAKMGHFSYLGDATVGSDANIGAGTITCNYDGTHKHPTQIGAGAFIGSDTMLIAPVNIGDGARTGAGAVVTHDVPTGETVVGAPARRFLPKDHDGKQETSDDSRT